MSNKRIVLTAVAALTILFVIWFFIAEDKTTAPSMTKTTNTSVPAPVSNGQTSQAPTDGKLYIGNRNAKVTIVEYADYKCPKCGDFHQKAGKELRSKYVETGQAKIEFRPFPLFGEDAGLALYGSYCANEQGKFTQYHDSVFSYMWENYFKSGNFAAENEQTLTANVLSGIASSAGIDITAFSTCLAGNTHKTAYDQAVQLAASDSVTGTPTFIIGSEKIVGPQPFNIFKVLLDLEVSR